MKAWVFQDGKQVKTKGPELASWYVGYNDPNGRQRCKSFGSGAKGKKLAKDAAEKISAQLLTGTFDDVSNKTWAEFRKEYDSKILANMEPGTRESTQFSLAHFERLIKPGKMQTITSRTLADFVSKRRQERGLKRGTLASKATINKELRHLRAVIRKAAKWSYVAKLPEFEFEKETQKLAIYVPPEHFAKMYAACDGAIEPRDVPNVDPADWWRGLFVMAYMTGWRISELLALKWSEVDLDAGKAVTKGETNKGRRDEMVKLHPLVVDHLRKLKTFESRVFPWNRNRRSLYVELQANQLRADVKPDHANRPYGFHDLRRGFATMNAGQLSADELQSLMRHKSYSTTQGYINMAQQLNRTTEKLFVPNVGKSATA